MKQILETPRLLLRELATADLEFVAEMLAHPEVMRFWPRVYSRGEAEEWIRRQQARYASHGYGYWLALAKETNQPVGQVGVLPQQVDDTEQTGLGYILHRPFWGCGFAAEAAAGCLEYAFEALGKKRVIALIRPENEPSQRVARKLGMELTGQTLYSDFDHLIYELRRQLGSR